MGWRFSISTFDPKKRPSGCIFSALVLKAEKSVRFGDLQKGFKHVPTIYTWLKCLGFVQIGRIETNHGNRNLMPGFVGLLDQEPVTATHHWNIYGVRGKKKNEMRDKELVFHVYKYDLLRKSKLIYSECRV